MDLRDLVKSLLAIDSLGARQWIADAIASGIRWSDISLPEGLDEMEMAVAAGVVELLATRTNQPSPRWTAAVRAAPHRIFLVPSASTMPRLRRLCEEEGPEPLRRRNVYAPPDFLTAA